MTSIQQSYKDPVNSDKFYVLNTKMTIQTKYTLSHFWKKYNKIIFLTFVNLHLPEGVKHNNYLYLIMQNKFLGKSKPCQIYKHSKYSQ